MERIIKKWNVLLRKMVLIKKNINTFFIFI